MALRLLVVDGYNVIREDPRYRLLVDDSPSQGSGDVYQRAREALIADVAAYAQGSYEAAIVFDGFGNLAPERLPVRTAGVSIVFSPTGVEADTVIERMVAQRRAEGGEVVVVTSDGGVQATVFGSGVTRVSSRMFSLEAQSMNAHVAEMRIAPHTGGPTHATVADRLSPEMRQRLKQMTLPRKERRRAQGR